MQCAAFRRFSLASLTPPSLARGRPGVKDALDCRERAESKGLIAAHLYEPDTGERSYTSIAAELREAIERGGPNDSLLLSAEPGYGSMI
jgi:hypothetical protein